jgi:hypothetical protein
MKKFIDYPLPGEKYLHYKGGMYEVICIANHTENNEAMVIYKSLSFGSIYARPLVEWFDVVEWRRSVNPYNDKRFVKHG